MILLDFVLISLIILRIYKKDMNSTAARFPDSKVARGSSRAAKKQIELNIDPNLKAKIDQIVGE